MSPPLLVTEEEGQSKVLSAASASLQSLDSFSQDGIELKEINYLGLSDCSSVDSCSPTVLIFSDEKKGNLNLKATELSLGLPGSQSPEWNTDLYSLSSAKLDKKLLFPLLPMKDEICLASRKTVVSGNKRGFADTLDGFPQGKFTGNTGMGLMLSPRSSGAQPTTVKEIQSNVLQERHCAANGASISGSAPAPKAQVVGWPPIRSFRKNSMATTSKNNDEVDGKPCPATLFVKVSMDGAPYLRKVDLNNYTTYQELSSALEKMFSCFTLGQCGSHGTPGKEMLSESKLRDLLDGSEYVVTYEDKDGDWMLVGDVPWDMFIDTCKRLKIMKGSDAIGLAPRAMEKSKSRS
ncbi:PREDICTED: auxin-responsive protein IAA9-like isoform X2 [Lupinus angustifolius]|uniref:auxin-responsive protein IAA9-like isoform X1 n=1 Tax=Lupinus angustifolius TaxID=3871 RepID=UPI00092E6D21|nr:PREDICTED: auxin-responsive protein IAA9-like isoform X1 [Lupinus angustifolius]XP_019445334.1 PREDICTED: auxin-responsive protein IAA9-like isoform X2 [Lupinus angustifolius]